LPAAGRLSQIGKGFAINSRHIAAAGAKLFHLHFISFAAAISARRQYVTAARTAPADSIHRLTRDAQSRALQ